MSKSEYAGAKNNRQDNLDEVGIERMTTAQDAASIDEETRVTTADLRRKDVLAVLIIGLRFNDFLTCERRG